MNLKKKIHYHDTDFSGAVYHANYLKYLEESRSAALEELGFSVSSLLVRGVGFAVRRQEMEYKAPAVYGDELDIETVLKEFSPYRMVFNYTLRNGEGRLIGKAATDLVCVGKDLKLLEIPQDLQAALRGVVGGA
jgi:acyl-CoA thioester hydrolase